MIIAFIGIVNTMTLSIYERTQEIGLLRAVGSSRRQVRSMVRWEAAIIALFGTLLGIAMALFFGWAVVRALHDQGFTKFSAAPDIRSSSSSSSLRSRRWSGRACPHAAPPGSTC